MWLQVQAAVAHFLALNGHGADDVAVLQQCYAIAYSLKVRPLAHTVGTAALCARRKWATC